MKKFYTDEKNTLILIALLKKHGIRKVVASPGTTNASFVGSIQNDPFFEIYSSVDERSAAYMACGLALESEEAVILTCTGATASRNYLSGLTEAFYRKLPVLAITSTQATCRVGHHVSQVIDRSSIQNDVAKHSVTLPVVKDSLDSWDCEVKINNALLELKRHGGGPVHINLPTIYSKSFETKVLPEVKVIKRFTAIDSFPELPKCRIAVFIGSHKKMSEDEITALDTFCATNDAVVFCDHTSMYNGKYRVLYPLAACQMQFDISKTRADLVIYIGEVSGDSFSIKAIGKEVWRVSEDGEIRDTFFKLTNVFEISEKEFFEYYTSIKNNDSDNYLKLCLSQIEIVQSKIPELPFSNIWIASKMASKLPEGSTIHLGILNSLRSWNFFDIPNTVQSSSNVGGFGIDGCVSTLFGASLAYPQKLFFGVVGDLAFFYDMNSIGNRHIGNNIRLLIVNNGVGTEFKNFNHKTAHFAEEGNRFIAAAGHFGQKSKTLIKNYSENLGFKYITASSKEEFSTVYEEFLNPSITDQPILFEVFTNDFDESNALQAIMNIESNTKGKAKDLTKKILGQNGVNTLKKALGR